MRNIMKISLLLTFALLLMVGCGNDDTKKNNNNNDGNSSENESSTNSNDGDQILQLGETGTIKDTTGEYEITPISFSVEEEWEGETPKIDGDVFLIVDVSIENIGKSTLKGEQLRKVDAIGGNETVVSNTALFEFIDQLEGELLPGEKMEGQFAFSLPPADVYQLVYGLHLGSVSNKITWELPANESK